MATADRQFWCGTATIAATTYPAATAPSLDGTIYIGAGCWSIYNPSATISLVCSENGTDDAFIVPPGLCYTVPSSQVVGKLWIKLSSAGSVSVTGNLTIRAAMEF